MTYQDLVTALETLEFLIRPDSGTRRQQSQWRSGGATADDFFIGLRLKIVGRFLTLCETLYSEDQDAEESHENTVQHRFTSL